LFSSGVKKFRSGRGLFCSLACDLRVTQLVDDNKGIHAMVERGLVQ
jgi:acetamidase/formamidase